MKLLPCLLFAAAFGFAADVKLGAPLALSTQTPIAGLAGKPADYAGKTVQVKGKITEVCQKMGCWMMLADPATNAAVRIKVKDGEIAFPKDAAGKTAIAEGKFTQLELSRDQAVAQARHEAEEQGRKFDPATVTGPKTTYQIAGTGAVILQ